MKRITISLLSLLAAPFVALAGPVTPQKAKEVAERLFGESSLRSTSNITLSYTHTPANALRQGGEDSPAYYYVFNRGEAEGFAIVSGDDRMHEVLAFSEAGRFDMEHLPAHIRAWMDLYDKEIAQVLLIPDTNLFKKNQVKTTGKKSVEPLLGNIRWDQDYPYNTLCPDDPRGKVGAKKPTGCVATAAGQIMRFHRWPNSATGSVSYYDSFSQENRSVDLGQSYDWNKMPEYYNPQNGNNFTQEQVQEVSKFMYDLGRATKMQYGGVAQGGSGAWEYDMLSAIRNNFHYRKDAALLVRFNYTANEWGNIIRKEIDERRPVFYTGYGEGGHAFLCDGYKEDGTFHFNWGWGGLADGYYQLHALKPEELGIGAGMGEYNLAQMIIVNFAPDKGGTQIQEPSKHLPSASIRVRIPNDKQTLVFSGALLQYPEESINGTARLMVCKAGEKTVLKEKTYHKILRSRVVERFSNEVITVTDLQDGSYVASIEWKHDGESDFKELPPYIDEPDKVLFTMEGGRIKEWHYNTAIEVLTFDANSIKANLNAYASSTVSVSITNNSDREYYGPLNLYIVPTGMYADSFDASRAASTLSEMVVVPAKQTITHTFTNFKTDYSENEKVDIYLQYAEVMPNTYDSDFARFTTRLNASEVKRYARNKSIVRPASYEETTLIATTELRAYELSIDPTNLSLRSFTIENRGTAVNMQAKGLAIAAIAIASSVGGRQEIIAVSNNNLCQNIGKGESVTFVPEFSRTSKFSTRSGQRIDVVLTPLYLEGNNYVGYASDKYPIFGDNSVTLKLVRGTAIDEVAQQDQQAGLYPTLASTNVHVTNGQPIVSVDVFSMEGKQLLSIAGNKASELDIDVTALPVGNYLVGVRSADNTVTTHRLVVVR